MFFASFIYDKYKYIPNKICTITNIIFHHVFRTIISINIPISINIEKPISSVLIPHSFSPGPKINKYMQKIVEITHKNLIYLPIFQFSLLSPMINITSFPEQPNNESVLFSAKTVNMVSLLALASSNSFENRLLKKTVRFMVTMIRTVCKYQLVTCFLSNSFKAVLSILPVPDLGICSMKII